MTSISSMISFVVLLLATYSYAAPIGIETKNNTMTVELQNSTTGISFENVAEVHQKKDKRGFFSDSTSEEFFGGFQKVKVRVFRPFGQTFVQPHTGFVQQSTRVIQPHTGFVQTGTVFRHLRDSTNFVEGETTIVNELNTEAETKESEKRETEVEPETKESDKRETETKESEKRETEFETETKESDKRETEVEPETKESDKRETEFETETKESEKRETEVEPETKESDKRGTEVETETKESDKRETETKESEKRETEVETETKESDKRGTEVETETKESDKRETEVETETKESDKRETETKESEKRETETKESEKRETEVETETKESDKRETEVETGTKDSNNRETETKDSNSRETETKESEKREVFDETSSVDFTTVEGSKTKDVERISRKFDFESFESPSDFDKRAIGSIQSVATVESTTDAKVEKETSSIQQLSSTNQFAKTTGLVGGEKSSTTTSETTIKTGEMQNSTKILAVIPGRITETKIVVQKPLSQGKN